MRHIETFSSAVADLPNNADATVDLAELQSRLDPITQSIDSSERGNSVADLLLTALGWKFAKMIDGQILTEPSQAADWLERNLGESAHPRQK